MNFTFLSNVRNERRKKEPRNKKEKEPRNKREREREKEKERHGNRFRFLDLNVDIDFKNTFYALFFRYSDFLFTFPLFHPFSLPSSHSFFLFPSPLYFSPFHFLVLFTSYPFLVSFSEEKEEERRREKKKGIKNEIFLHKILLNFPSESETRRKEECDNLHLLPSSFPPLSLSSIFSPIFLWK